VTDIDAVKDLITVKTKNGFTGSLVINYNKGIITNVEKVQSMNNQRISRELKRDTNAIESQSRKG